MEKPSKELLVDYFLGKITDDVAQAIEAYLALNCDTEFIEYCLKEASLQIAEEKLAVDSRRKDDLWGKLVEQQIKQLKHGVIIRGEFSLYRRLAISAAILLFLTFAAVIFRTLEKRNVSNMMAVKEETIVPGSDKAMLTLADGRHISLSDVANGKLASNGGVEIEKTQDGEVVYKGEATRAEVNSLIHTISTPKAGQYRITLPDGTKAWLNAASSLSYPTIFNSQERKVSMTGEVYFEVAKRVVAGKRIPFIVETDKQQIEVLGTHFNVNAYKDETGQRTTLSEGSVRVTDLANQQSVLLKPGQQAQLTNRLMLIQVDLEEELAWVAGDFIFKDAQLGEILRNIARWYDVEISCPPGLANRKLSGILSRNLDLQSLIKSINALGSINLELQGRRLIVRQ